MNFDDGHDDNDIHKDINILSSHYLTWSIRLFITVNRAALINLTI